MAGGVKAKNRPVIHQTVHGYADGHRQLVASTTLKPRDVKTMLVLSDISGPGTSIGGAGYLTGYPLAESGVYALARTWAAPEMPRPGCVWTHTLLVDFSDLATLSALERLDQLFRRPNPEDLATYARSLVLADERAVPTILSDTDRIWGSRLLAALYGETHSPVVATRPEGVDVDGVVLSLWAQQWPRLRRTFRFCTLAAVDRSNEAGPFDLQISPARDRGIRTRFSNAIDVDSLSTAPAPWLTDALKDLERPDVHGLRSFMRRVGGDVSIGREAFRSVCHLHQLVRDFQSTPAAVGQAIPLLQADANLAQSRSAQAIVAGAALQHVDRLDQEAIEFVLEHFDVIDQQQQSRQAEQLGRAMWRIRPDWLIRLLEREDSLREVGRGTIERVPMQELVRVLGEVAVPLRVATVDARPEVLKEPSFWAASDGEFIQVVAHYSLERNTWVAAALIQAARHDLADVAVRELGVYSVLPCVGAAMVSAAGKELKLDRWVKACVWDLPLLARVLAGDDEGRPLQLLVAIARVVRPDAVPNEVGVDPWLMAFRTSTGTASDNDTRYLGAFLLTRALGAGSRNRAELAQVAFDTVHEAAAMNLMPDDAWALMESRLPWPMFWQEWDRCERIRSGVVDMFVDSSLAPEAFVRVSKHDNVFQSLVEVAARSFSGRRYLHRVRDVLVAERDSSIAARLAALDGVMF